MFTGIQIEPSLIIARARGGEIVQVAREMCLRSDEIVACAIPSTDVLIRRVKLEVTKSREIAAALPFQIEPLLPLPLDEMVYDYQIVGEGEVVVFAVPKKRLEKHIQEMAAAGIQPERISAVPAALAAITPVHKKPVGVLHRNGETTCLLVHEKKVLAAHAFEEANAQEIAKAFYAMESRHKVKIDRVYHSFPEAAIPMGLALDSSINFRKKGPVPWRRLRKPLAVAGALVLALTFACSILSGSLLKRKREALWAEYASLEALTGRSSALERSPEIIVEKARQLERELSQVPASYSLIPKTLAVTELINYLSSLDLSFEVEELSYQMREHPTKKRPNDPYRVRVHLTLRSPFIRELHEALKKISEGDLQWNHSQNLVHATFNLRSYS